PPRASTATWRASSSGPSPPRSRPAHERLNPPRSHAPIPPNWGLERVVQRAFRPPVALHPRTGGWNAWSGVRFDPRFEKVGEPRSADLLGLALPVGLAELELLELAGGGAWQLV